MRTTSDLVSDLAMGDAPSVRYDEDLWTCPRCGRRFVTRNLWHACGDYSVEGFLEGKGSRARELFDRFEELIAACGLYEVAPAKTRVAFMGRVRFAGVTSVSDRGMTLAFGLPRTLTHPRIRKVERIGPSWHVHTIRVASREELDEQLLEWLRESWPADGDAGAPGGSEERERVTILFFLLPRGPTGPLAAAYQATAC